MKSVSKLLLETGKASAECRVGLLDKPTPTKEELAQKYEVSLDEVERVLEKGVKIEMEHTSHRDVAMEIALDHLGERLTYYDTLKD